MLKKAMYLTAPVLVTIYFISSFVFAQDTTADAKARLKNVREEKAQIAIDYDKQLHEGMVVFEKKLAATKVEYRKAYEEIKNEKDAKYDELRINFETKLKALMKEEEDLINVIGPGAVSDFVKTKLERKAAN